MYEGLKKLFNTFDSKTITPDKFYAFIEIPKGAKIKYEFDKQSGQIRMDRILYTSTHYPHNYGFIPLTHCDDGDPLDVLVLCSDALVPATIVECKPIGVLEMLDNGRRDSKVIAVPIHDPYYCVYNDISEIPMHVAEEIKHFFDVYKNLENLIVNTGDVDNSFVAKKVIAEAIELYKNTNFD